ncbi:MAG: JmjC domain-containing protein [Formosimonas sp.]
MKTTALHAQFCTFPDDTPRFNGQPIPLGGLSVETFLKDYWHKKPLLIRNALPEFKAFYTPEMVRVALQDEHIESRLIVQNDGKWQMRSGPLRKKHMPSKQDGLWTALIQGVDLHHALGHALLNLFRFIPDARLDDLMVSLANDGGGVGPHYDSYDVFLLQAHGQRRWQIGAGQDLSLKPNLPLKILQNFSPTEEFVLNAGDMLYLPPHYAHDGVAIGECMTYSIGFRAPTYREIGVALLNFVEDNLELEGRYADPDLAYQTTPAALPEAMVDDMAAQLEQMRWDKTWVAECLGCYLSEPKNNAWFEPNDALTLDKFIKTARKNGLTLAPATKMLYHVPWVFINGEHLMAQGQDAQDLHDLANARRSAAQFTTDADIWPVLYEWFNEGWLRCD